MSSSMGRPFHMLRQIKSVSLREILGLQGKQIKFEGLEDFTATCLSNLCLDTVWGVGHVEDSPGPLETLLCKVEPTL